MENIKDQGQNQMANNVYRDHGMLTGMFADLESPAQAYNTLHEKRYTMDDINLSIFDIACKNHFSVDVKETEIEIKAAEGAGKGYAIGGAIGCIAGIVAAIGTGLIIPAPGMLIAGLIAVGLAGAGAGGFAGGIIGAWIRIGLPDSRNEEDAKYFEKAWRDNKSEEVYL